MTSCHSPPWSDSSRRIIQASYCSKTSPAPEAAAKQNAHLFSRNTCRYHPCNTWTTIALKRDVLCLETLLCPWPMWHTPMDFPVLAISVSCFIGTMGSHRMNIGGRIYSFMFFCLHNGNWIIGLENIAVYGWIINSLALVLIIELYCLTASSAICVI